jgi:hypothetical protein
MGKDVALLPGDMQRDRRSSLASFIVALLILATACGTKHGSQSVQPRGAGSTSSTPAPAAAPKPAACKRWGCQPHQTVQLTDSRAVTLWLGRVAQDYESRPVLELQDHGVAVQWWISPQGDGWAGSLTCETSGPEPNCVLLDSLGMHASVAETVMIRAGRLIHPDAAEVTTNTAGAQAVDLNADGYLDVIGRINDYRPNFAQGHTYWQTFRYSDGRLIATGCAPQIGDGPAPTQLLSGSCPMP